jgi:hypothetical protein
MKGSVEITVTVQLGGGRPQPWTCKATFDNSEPPEDIKQAVAGGFGQVRAKVAELLGDLILEKKP